MLIGTILLICVASVPLAGGRLLALADLHFRHTWVAVAGLLMQVLIISVLPGGHGTGHQVVHVASYAPLAWFVIANRGIPGLLIVGIGGLLNLVAIVANHGVMPAAASALDRAGIEHVPGSFSNSIAVSDPRLGFLGDIFAVPSWLPVHNVFSIGDVLIAVGALVLLHATCGSRIVPASLRNAATPHVAATAGAAEPGPSAAVRYGFVAVCDERGEVLQRWPIPDGRESGGPIRVWLPQVPPPAPPEAQRARLAPPVSPGATPA